MVSNWTKIAVIIAFLALFYAVYSDLSESPKIVTNQNLNAPEEFDTDSSSIMYLKLQNVGESFGKYSVTAKSDCLLVDISNQNLGTFSNSDYTSKYIESGSIGNWLIYLKANESNLSPNATLVVTLNDITSDYYIPQQIWEFNYMLDNSERDSRYILLDKTFEKKRILLNVVTLN